MNVYKLKMYTNLIEVITCIQLIQLDRCPNISPQNLNSIAQN